MIRQPARFVFCGLLIVALSLASYMLYTIGHQHGYSVANAETDSVIAERNAARAQVSALLAVPGTTTLDCRMISWTP